jgi:hypothetical protein
VGNARRPQPESNRPGSLCRRFPYRSGMRPGCAFHRECFRQESNLRLQLRRLVSYPLDHGSVRAPGWIRTTVSEEPGLQPGAIDRSATDASCGEWRDSNPAWTGVTARCLDPSASSSVRDDGIEPPAGPVLTGCSAAELIACARPWQESNPHRQLRRLLACPLATGTWYPLETRARRRTDYSKATPRGAHPLATEPGP